MKKSRKWLFCRMLTAFSSTTSHVEDFEISTEVIFIGYFTVGERVRFLFTTLENLDHIQTSRKLTKSL